MSRSAPFASVRWVATLGLAFLASGSAFAAAVGGTVFEDMNYGGGSGRNRTAAAGIVRPNVRVEIYNAAGNFVSATTTDASGNYTFNVASGSYTIRVVSGTLTSSRPGAVGTLVPVQTYRTNASSGSVVAVTDRVGGEVPGKADAGNGSTTLAALTTATTTAQSITAATFAGNLGGLDFGFNFNTIVNVNDGGQGSLRQFLSNSNALGNTGLAIQGQTAGKDVSVFMISDGQAHPGLRAGLANLLTGGGVAVIVPATALPAISDADTTLDGTTQTANVGNTNAVVLGVGGTVGVDNIALSQTAGPEVEIRDGGSLPNGIQIQANNVTARGLAILGFGGVDGEAGILVADTFTGILIENNVLGSGATSLTDPGAGLHNWAGVYVAGADNGTVQNNLVAFSGRAGISLNGGSANWTVTGNEVRDAGTETTDGDGVTVNASSGSAVAGNLVTGASSQGFVVTGAGSTGSTFTNNTVTGCGVGTTGSLTQSAGIALRSTAGSSLFDRNVIRANYGAGLAVNNGATGIRMTRNSFFDNGTITARNGGGATGQIGIDLNAATDNQDLGTAPFVTRNDSGDGDGGGNGLLNFPVLTNARIAGANLTVTGHARPGSVIEVFAADADPTNFGEGKTYLFSATEGSVADADGSTGTYGPGPVNGLSQGTDTTNRFSFTVPLPPGVTPGTVLTATATDGAGNTSEFGGVVIASLSSIVKRGFLLDGTPLPDGVVVPRGTRIRFLLYINNLTGAIADVSLADALDPAFAYIAGSIRTSNTVAACAAATCTPAEEAAILAAANAAAAGSDAIDLDTVSFSGATVRAGNQAVANAQLDIAGARVFALVFSVRVQ